MIEFAYGLIVGLVIGATVGMLLLAMCITSARAEDQR
jgi:hypothetical protein